MGLEAYDGSCHGQEQRLLLRHICRTAGCPVCRESCQLVLVMVVADDMSGYAKQEKVLVH